MPNIDDDADGICCDDERYEATVNYSVECAESAAHAADGDSEQVFAFFAWDDVSARTGLHRIGQHHLQCSNCPASELQ